jgi:hypothetical protein
MKMQFEVTEQQLKILQSKQKRGESLGDTIRRLLFSDGIKPPDFFEELFGKGFLK